LVIRDSGGKDPQTAAAGLNILLSQSRFKLTFPVHYYATRCMLETWLLADEHAVNKVALSRGRPRSIKPSNKRLEEIMDPKPLFLKALSQAGLPADDKVYEEIASATDLDKIAERCPRFVEFRARRSTPVNSRDVSIDNARIFAPRQSPGDIPNGRRGPLSVGRHRSPLLTAPSPPQSKV
jgi:hypothetical protein